MRSIPTSSYWGFPADPRDFCAACGEVRARQRLVSSYSFACVLYLVESLVPRRPAASVNRLQLRRRPRPSTQSPEWRPPCIARVRCRCRSYGLGYFKYSDFFVAQVGFLTQIGLGTSGVGTLLPLGVSFYTFTQIAYLADVYANKAQEYAPANYALLVAWVSHLIAGPIMHHREMMPQFATAFRAKNRLATGTDRIVDLQCRPCQEGAARRSGCAIC